MGWGSSGCVASAYGPHGRSLLLLAEGCRHADSEAGAGSQRGGRTLFAMRPNPQAGSPRPWGCTACHTLCSGTGSTLTSVWRELAMHASKIATSGLQMVEALGSCAVVVGRSVNRLDESARQARHSTASASARSPRRKGHSAGTKTPEGQGGCGVDTAMAAMDGGGRGQDRQGCGVAGLLQRKSWDATPGRCPVVVVVVRWNRRGILCSRRGLRS